MIFQIPLSAVSLLYQTIVDGTHICYRAGPTTPGQVQLNPGDIIDTSGVYYIFVGPDANGCTNESSFNAYFIDEYIPNLDHCGVFTVPSVPYNIGDFYTEPEAPLGNGAAHRNNLNEYHKSFKPYIIMLK